MELFETYQQILQEAEVVNSEILDAINNRQVIRFFYEGDGTESKGERLGELYAYGESIKGNPVVRVFQLRGATDSLNFQYKLFRVDKMRDVEQVREFFRARAGFN